MDIIPPLLPADAAPPLTHTLSSTRTLRPRPARLAEPERVHASRKRGHTQRDVIVQEQLLPRKRGKMSGVVRRNGSAGAPDDTDAVGGVVGTRVSGVRGNARRTSNVVVKEEATSALVLSSVGGGGSGGSAGSDLSPTRDVEAEVGVQGDDGVKVEVKREVKEEVKGKGMEESGDDEDDEDGEYSADDDEDGCGSGDTGEDSDGDIARVKTEIKREVKREVRRDMGTEVEEDVSRGTVQLTATQNDTGVRARMSTYVSATNPHGFRPATLARLQELSPEAREREVKKLLKQRVYTAKRLSDPAVRQMVRMSDKEYYEKNIEKVKQRKKEYHEKNIDKVKQRKKEYREKNKDKVKQRSKEYYEKNKDKLKQRNKEFREKNKDKVNQRKKEYREKNKEKVKQRKKEYLEKNKEKVKQRSKEYYEKSRERVNARHREMYARKKAEREGAQRAATGTGTDAHVANA